MHTCVMFCKCDVFRELRVNVVFQAHQDSKVPLEIQVEPVKQESQEQGSENIFLCVFHVYLYSEYYPYLIYIISIVYVTLCRVNSDEAVL